MHEVNEFLFIQSPELPDEIQEILNDGLAAGANPQNENAPNEIAQIENKEEIE